MPTEKQSLLNFLNVDNESMVSKSQLIHVAHTFQRNNEILKNLISELTVDLFCENPNHPRFAEFSPEDVNRLRTVKFGGKIQ